MNTFKQQVFGGLTRTRYASIELALIYMSTAQKMLRGEISKEEMGITVASEKIDKGVNC